MKKRKAMGIGGIQIGTSFLVLIFVVLALVIFSVLSLLAVISDDKLTQKNLSYVEAFYNADGMAEERVAQVNKTLKIMDEKGNLSESGIVETFGVEYDAQTDLLEFSVAINEKLGISVALKIYVEPLESGKYYSIVSWKEENTAEYEIDESVNVWAGEN